MLTRKLAQTAQVLALLGLPAVTMAAGKGWVDNVEEAVKTAQNEKKDLLLDFTGSDWCPPCMALNREVLSTESFISEWSKDFVLVELDFPNNKPQSDEIKRMNNEWNQRFNIRGYPTIILADSSGLPYAQTVGYGGGPEAWQANLKKARELKTKRDEAFARAEKAQGIEKAKALDEGLSVLDPAIVPAYEKQVDEIIALDADNSAGLKEKYQAIKDERENAKKQGEVIAFLQPLRELAEKGDHDGALKLVDEAITKFQPKGELLQQLHLVKFQIQMAAQNPKAALQELDKAIAVAPNSELSQGRLQAIRHQIQQQVGDQ